MRKLLLSITAFAALVALPAQSQDGLPDFGEGNAVSLNQEYMLGRAWLMQFRRQAPLLADPLLQDYIEELIFRLAQTSQLRERWKSLPAKVDRPRSMISTTRPVTLRLA